MERIDISKIYEHYELSKIIHQNRAEVGGLPIHEFCVDKYITLVSFYPFGDKKEKVFKFLSKAQKMGMLNRHVLSVARQLGISNILIKKAKETTKNLASTKNNKNNLSYFNPTYYEEQEIKYRYKLEEYYTLILDIIIEEIECRKNIKYLRKKKLDEITNLSIE